MRLVRLFALMVGLLVIGLPLTLAAHETKEVAGLMVTFGAEPEPALSGQLQFLRWRFRAKETKEAFADVEQLVATIKRDGKDYGPFTGRAVARDPGLFQTQHIFTAPGVYEATLTFKKKGAPETHSIVFEFRIQDAKELEIP